MRLIEVVDVACGPGGFSEGWYLATSRKDNVLGVDFNETARKSYEAAGFKSVHGDLFDTDDFVRRVLDETGNQKPRVVIGSSSCKGWTALGNRKGAEDPRDTLLPWLKAVGKLSPEIAIMENVKQASKHPHWIDGLNALGMPLVGVWTLKAHHYGAPTKRERTFWIWRRDNYWPMMPVLTPVEVKYPSVTSNVGGQYGVRRIPENTYLYCRVDAKPGAKYKERWTILTVEEALEAQGASGKVFHGTPRERAQQIADMVPPPLAAAVIRAATVGLIARAQ